MMMFLKALQTQFSFEISFLFDALFGFILSLQLWMRLFLNFFFFLEFFHCCFFFIPISIVKRIFREYILHREYHRSRFCYYNVYKIVDIQACRADMTIHVFELKDNVLKNKVSVLNTLRLFKVFFVVLIKKNGKRIKIRSYFLWYLLQFLNC